MLDGVTSVTATPASPLESQAVTLSAVVGAGPWVNFRRITLPLLRQLLLNQA